ncbi:MAG: N-acyl homoserine lactonase AiiB [Stenotrophomonas maltophilia]|uniref:N-acyl homoserine lactonase AiiB n=1 Tax=Stenotrophomonas maltophilia TaxID=40324 RepID=A0A7V8FDQ1_STEMA|nr:MAG: N-acyl homoserine lactonase AiiB [Stenotrophomonas maltophilia]
MVRLDWQLIEADHYLHPQCAVRQGGSWRSCEFPALAALLRHPQRGLVLFDTGYSEAFFAATDRFPERLYCWVTPVRLAPGQSVRAQLQQRGIAAAQIGLVVLSHLHGDHVGGVLDFPGVPLLCSRAAWQDQAARGRLRAPQVGLLPALTRDAAPRMGWLESLPAVDLPRPFDAFGVGRDVLGDRSLLAVPLPGHAVGQHGLLFHAEDGRPVFLVADAAWSSAAVREGVPPPRLVTALLGSTGAYRQTLQRLQRAGRAVDDLQLVPAHCAEWRPHRHGPGCAGGGHAHG